MFKKLSIFIIIITVVVSLSVFSKQVLSTNTSSKIKASDIAFKIKIDKASKIEASDSFNDIRVIQITNTETELDKNVRKLSESDGQYDCPNTTHLILGSVEYVQAINDIAKEYGNQTAFSAIMIDVDQNGSELDNNYPNSNISRFKKLVSSLIYKIGYVDMQAHYFKNKLNRAPNTLKELIDLNKTFPINKRWILLSVAGSGYHMQGVDGEYNLKFESYDYYDEAVYNKKGILLTENNDPINMGSFNFGISSRNDHIRFDQYPYLLWGNAANSLEKGIFDIDKGVELGLINYKIHAKSVYLYRQNLFGMQQGRVI